MAIIQHERNERCLRRRETEKAEDTQNFKGVTNHATENFQTEQYRQLLDDFAFDAPFGIAHRDAKHEWNGLMKMDIRDKDGQYTADIELPGCKKEDIAIELNNGYLTVTANSRYENDEKGDDGKFIRRERFTGQCSRSLFIGEHVKQEDVKAKFENGVLSLTFPKEGEEAKKSTTIAIEG